MENQELITLAVQLAENNKTLVQTNSKAVDHYTLSDKDNRKLKATCFEAYKLLIEKATLSKEETLLKQQIETILNDFVK